jgi:carboxymethylenebutenolidase
MSEFTTLMARDGHEFNAWLAAPAGKPRGAIVVIQEIFGANAHIRAVTDGFAAEGYVAIAPALFDRVRRGIELGYTADTMKEGFGYVQQLQRDKTLLDLAACIAVVKHAGRVGVVGFCWGGRMAYVAACELSVACGVAYYGGGIAQELGKTPRCPMLYHFGGQDTHIPQSDVEKIRAADPRGTFYIYPEAEHGFNCDLRGSFNAAAAQLARQRTLAFFGEHLRGAAVAPPA